ncbi:MAG TPA: SPOR domain-containing protein [Pyrinomonadaceae bacterium]|nr:SPOR domain-containing protein [Pyrinomonadaceae bacterium]
MKIICMDCHNETHLEVEMLKDKNKMTCARCEENSQAKPAGDLNSWSAPPQFEEPKATAATTDDAFEVLPSQASESDVLEIPEKSLELYDPERAEAEEFILYEPEVLPAVEAPRAEEVEESPDVLFFSKAEGDTEPPPVDLGVVDEWSPREEPAPVQLIEAAPQAESAAPGKVKLLRFSTASLAAGLTVSLAFIFLGDTFFKSSGDITQVTAAPRQTTETKKQAAVLATTPAPQPSATPAPTPAPTPEPKQEAEPPAPQPVETQPSTAAGRFAVQVGSYNEVGQANERAEKLRAAGYDPRVVSVELPKRGTWYRVMVGSFSDRAEANRFGTQMRAKGAAQDFVIGDL